MKVHSFFHEDVGPLTWVVPSEITIRGIYACFASRLTQTSDELHIGLVTLGDTGALLPTAAQYDQVLFAIAMAADEGAAALSIPVHITGTSPPMSFNLKEGERLTSRLEAVVGTMVTPRLFTFVYYD